MTKIINLSIIFAVIFILLADACSAQETSWLEKLKQIEPLKSTEKDIERLYGKPTKSYSNIAEFDTDAGELTVYYSEGKCRSNENSEYDVEKGVVVEFDFTPKYEIKLKSLNINLVGFVKEYGGDALGVFSYKNEALGIDYSLYQDRLTYISVVPAKSYAYLECPRQAKPIEPLIDDVDQATLVNLTQLKPLQDTREDVAALFGEPLKGEENLDFYLNQKYALTFLYSTGKCTSVKDDNFNVSKGKLIRFAIAFNINGVASSLDLSKLKQKDDKQGFSIFLNELEGIEYKIKDNRIWGIYYYPLKKYEELKCVKESV